MSQKVKELLAITAIYLLSFAMAYAVCLCVEGTMLRFFVFDVAATVAVYLFSAALGNSSVYDPYWSLTPMVMSIWLFIEAGAASFWQLLFLTVFNVWGLRLTLNWIIVTTGFSYEDWRYRMLREKSSPLMWIIVNFFGIHMVPTLVVFAGMLPLFEIAVNPLGVKSLPGVLVILMGVALEFFADRQMHAFLARPNHMGVCREGLWAVSRHPNYLGEITVWVGTFLAMVPYAASKWYYGIGALSVAVLFLVVSVPMMEKRQLSRRPEYAQYRRETPCLLPLGGKRTERSAVQG